MSYTIGQVAKRTEIGIETIRFYERKGLIAEPPRRESGYRDYPEETVARVKFIRRAKDLGFSLGEIKELLSLRAKPDAHCADVYEQAEGKIADIDGKIRTLKAMRKALSKLMDECDGTRPVTECPILESLESEKTK